jgi:soluble lytic murein transglycosylase-like protein
MRITIQRPHWRQNFPPAPASAMSFRPTGGSIRIPAVARQLLFAAAAACTVAFTATRVHPVFLGQAPVAGRVLAAAYLDSATVRAPWLSLPEPLAMRHPQFLRDVEAFAADLRQTGQIDAERADTIARVAVREAYHRRVPPALVFGVMLTENDRFARNARSKVGAMGLMQIMPRMWTPNLGPILGRNLKDDETNLRYGVYILKHFAKRTADTLDARNVITTALLSYNGCVRGKNTPDCRAYPEKVQRHIDESARTLCSGLDFHQCVALPLWAALRDTAPPPMPSPPLANVLPETVTDRSHDAPRTAVRQASQGAWLGEVVSLRRE